MNFLLITFKQFIFIFITIVSHKLPPNYFVLNNLWFVYVLFIHVSFISVIHHNLFPVEIHIIKNRNFYISMK